MKPLSGKFLSRIAAIPAVFLGISRHCDLLLGIPAYEDAGTGYHHPRVENLSSALRGISAADRPIRHGGIAIYCEWEMDETKWRIWRQFIR